MHGQASLAELPQKVVPISIRVTWTKVLNKTYNYRLAHMVLQGLSSIVNILVLNN